jgi:hypothetical protein
MENSSLVSMLFRGLIKSIKTFRASLTVRCQTKPRVQANVHFTLGIRSRIIAFSTTGDILAAVLPTSPTFGSSHVETCQFIPVIRVATMRCVKYVDELNVCGASAEIFIPVRCTAHAQPEDVPDEQFDPCTVCDQR